MLDASTSQSPKQLDSFRFVDSDKDQKQLPVFENISKHISVLHHRNAQFRNAILTGSKVKVRKRHKQFLTVLGSYVRLIVMELHGPITASGQIDDNEGYTKIRSETFSGYEDLIKTISRSTQEILDMGDDFTRELFLLELQLKRYQSMEQLHIYPLYKRVSV